MNSPLVVDWSAIIADLRRHGISTYQLEGLVGISKSQLVGYGAGTSAPLHAPGERLIEFWCQITTSTREQLPRTRPPLSAARV